MTKTKAESTATTRSEERARAYKENLKRLYFGHIQLLDAEVPTSSAKTLEHTCMFCGASFAVKPKTLLAGKGCPVCRTTASSMKLLEEYIQKIDAIHGTQFLLQPRLIPNFTLSFAHLFKCRTCKRQLKLHPSTLLLKGKEKFKCHICTSSKMAKRQNFDYALRLEAVYGSKMRHIGKFSANKPITHVCTRRKDSHEFKETVLNMLRGVGCPKCNTSDYLQRQIEPMSYRHRNFVFSRRLEYLGFYEAISAVGGLENLQTKYSYPIPILYKGHVPAFLDVKRRTLIDVMSEDKFKTKFKRVLRHMSEAHKLNYTYAVIVATGTYPQKGIAVYYSEKRIVSIMKTVETIEKMEKVKRLTGQKQVDLVKKLYLERKQLLPVNDTL